MVIAYGRKMYLGVSAAFMAKVPLHMDVQPHTFVAYGQIKVKLFPDAFFSDGGGTAMSTEGILT